MSSQSEDESADDFQFDADQVMTAKRNNPGMFVSAWEADENNIDSWSKVQIKASENGDLETVRKMIEFHENNADSSKNINQLLTVRDQDGYTALHRAAYGGHTNVLQYLIIQGANMNNLTEDGWTPLHSAAFWNQLGVARLLLEAGADSHCLTNSNQSVLHLAISNNQGPETFFLLLSQPNVSFKVKNKLGDTVLDLVQRNTHYGDLCYAFSEAATCLTKSKQICK